jgi:hypothetical protein
VTSTLTVEPLTAADRCDRCGEYAPKLRELDAVILDESERLDETQPTPAASAGLPD